MPGSWTTFSVLDADGFTRTMRAWDESGVGSGPFSFGQIIADGSGAGSPITAITTGVAGTASSQVVTIQGVTSMTPLQDNITQLGGNAIATGLGATTSGSPRITLASDSVGIIPTGSAGTPATTVLTVQGITGGFGFPIASSTNATAVTPTVTAGSYTAGFIMGGIMTFATLLDSVRFAGILESITVKYKATVVAGTVTLSLFKASPSNGTYADHTAGTWNGADMANLVGVFQLAAPLSPLGTMTVYNLNGIGKAIVGTTQSLFGILTVSGTPTPASSSDMIVELAVLPG